MNTPNKQEELEKEIEKKRKKAVIHHLNNIKILSKRKPSIKELEQMYSYLDYCFICQKPITLWDRLTFNVSHGFEGNAHRRDCI